MVVAEVLPIMWARPGNGEIVHEDGDGETAGHWQKISSSASLDTEIGAIELGNLRF